MDDCFKSILRPHQIAAVLFILDRLEGSGGTGIYFGFSIFIIFSVIQSLQNFSYIDRMNPTGAILGDDMGTGKTLIALASAWTICKKNSCKGVIVCPPSLVENWKLEITKWFPSTLALTTLFVTRSTTSDGIVNEFVTSHPTRRPLLVLGYEMFRVYAEALNTITTLDFVACDEGHRLKNASGTKTTLALSNCIAMKRLLLTGTPIQNNLAELYSLVQFVAPGYLGTLKEFNDMYADKITKGKAKSSSAKQHSEGKKSEEQLQQLLSRIMLRRTSDELLKTILAVRKEFIIYCSPLEQQLLAYKKVAHSILTVESSMKNRCSEGILPALTSLRLISTSVPLVANQASSESAMEKREQLLSRSAKYQFIDALIRSVLLSPSKDKIVVVSNFTSILDDVQSLCVNSCAVGAWSNCAALRIDGSVPLERRNKIVQVFNGDTASNNNSSSCSTSGCSSMGSLYRILLLSSKAGGVGLNLVGANRLVMMDPDWNPASDMQAMARVWRQGQRKEVYIYRLISHGTIEESILQRQLQKFQLHSIAEKASDKNEAEREIVLKRKRESDDDDQDIEVGEFHSLELLKSLIYPEPQHNNCTEKMIMAVGNEDSIISEACEVLKQSKREKILSRIVTK